MWHFCISPEQKEGRKGWGVRGKGNLGTCWFPLPCIIMNEGRTEGHDGLTATCHTLGPCQAKDGVKALRWNFRGVVDQKE